jgi:type I restriction-modification system DNA methylase subunit
LLPQRKSPKKGDPRFAAALGNAPAEADILGQAYEYLIKKFADLTNKKAGEFYTPRSVVRMLDPRQGETIYDPACGTGGMLESRRNRCGRLFRCCYRSGVTSRGV